MTVLAHIAGVPIEETALSMAPLAGLLGGALFLRLRAALGRGGDGKA